MRIFLHPLSESSLFAGSPPCCFSKPRKALPPDAIMDPMRRDYLELTYLHLASLNTGRAPPGNAALKEPGGMLQ
jgi:hypothetical protein